MCRKFEEAMVTPSKRFGPHGGHQMYHHQKGSNTKRPNSTPISSSPSSKNSQHKTPAVGGGHRLNKGSPPPPPCTPPKNTGSIQKTPATRSHSTPVAVPNRGSAYGKAGHGGKFMSPSPSRMSPKSFASSKCFEPPTPTLLPEPPTNWMMNGPMVKSALVPQTLNFDYQDVRVEGDSLLDLSHQLKLILKVQA